MNAEHDGKKTKTLLKKKFHWTKNWIPKKLFENFFLSKMSNVCVGIFRRNNSIIFSKISLTLYFSFLLLSFPIFFLTKFHIMKQMIDWLILKNMFCLCLCNLLNKSIDRSIDRCLKIIILSQLFLSFHQESFQNNN